MRVLVILAVLACGLLPLRAATFVQLADPQLGMAQGVDTDLTTFTRAVAQINALKPDFVLLCGDLVHFWKPDTARAFAKAAAGFTMPWYVAPGNHDRWDGPVYKELFGADHRVVNTKAVTVIITNSNLWADESKADGDAQLTWLAQALKDAPADKPVFVVGHHPLYLAKPDEKNEYFNVPLARRTAVLDLLTARHVTAYLSGHKHESIVNDYQGVALVSQGSSVKNMTREPLGFRLWTIDEKGKATHAAVALAPADAAK
jgi:3',5'-cyclic AMP phosphodiesterase CpdA